MAICSLWPLTTHSVQWQFILSSQFLCQLGFKTTCSSRYRLPQLSALHIQSPIKKTKSKRPTAGITGKLVDYTRYVTDIPETRRPKLCSEVSASVCRGVFTELESAARLKRHYKGDRFGRDYSAAKRTEVWSEGALSSPSLSTSWCSACLWSSKIPCILFRPIRWCDKLNMILCCPHSLRNVLDWFKISYLIPWLLSETNVRKFVM